MSEELPSRNQCSGGGSQPKMALSGSMKVLSWNCRGLESLSTISQLKEELRIYLPDLVFLCETKNKKSFVQGVYKKLKSIPRWEIVKPISLSGGLLLGYSDKVVVKQIVAHSLCFEVEFEE